MTTIASTNQPWGTWPVRMHADRFFGTVKADGQHPRVAGLACYKGDVVAISLVGYDTSISAVLASLWLRESVPFLSDGRELAVVCTRPPRAAETASERARDSSDVRLPRTST